MPNIEPAYRRLLAEGRFAERVQAATDALTNCTLCGWECGIDRTQRTSHCRTGEQAVVSSAFPHMGEEDPLRGTRGSGTIFFAHCNLRCQYCQNYDISQHGNGRAISTHDLAALMLRLQGQGCHNINFVSPSHVIPQIIAAVHVAAQRGLAIPLVYNTGGYESLDGLRLLDGIIDIYMPDMKYADAKLAQRYSKVPDYPARNQAAVREMHRQVGDLQLDADGIAVRGLLVRHLVLPDDIAGSESIIDFLAQEISQDTYINIMGQYHPAWHAHDRKLAPLDRPVRPDEVSHANRLAETAGLRLDYRRGWLARWN